MNHFNQKQRNEYCYNFLTDNNYQWDRRGQNEIHVWVSGYKTEECREVEKFLRREAQMYCIAMDFNEMCGKTCCIFKHK